MNSQYCSSKEKEIEKGRWEKDGVARMLCYYCLKKTND